MVRGGGYSKMTRLRGRQDGMTVFSVESDNTDHAEREAARYAAQYAQDGDVEIQHHISGRWRRRAIVPAGTKSFTLRPIPPGAKLRGFGAQSEERRREIAMQGVRARAEKTSATE